QKAAGSALFKDPALVTDILRSVVAAVEIPVTLKIRTGWCPESRNGVEVARIAQAEGIQMLSVHGRTREVSFTGGLEYDTIAAIKQSVAIPVIANGDIDSPTKAGQVLTHTGADGVMIGRAAQGNPWIFEQISHYLDTGELLARRPLPEVRDRLLRHIRELHELYGEFRGVLFARKHVGWYTSQCSGAIEFRRTFNQISNPEQQLQHVAAYFEALQHNKEYAA